MILWASEIRGILSVGKELEATVLDMIEQLIDEDSAIVSIYYGEDAGRCSECDR